MHLSRCVHVSTDSFGSQKGTLDPLELDLDMVVSCRIWMLETKFRLFVIVGCVIDCWVIFLDERYSY